MLDSLPLAISILSLAVSAVTAWLTLFRRGTVRMTQPTVIYFGPDVPRSRDHEPLPKIYLRTLLFSTSKRGRIIESMHVAISRNETQQNFNIWVYGEREKIVRGSGLFVGEQGIAANHHFLTPDDGNKFQFTEGQYVLTVIVRLLNDKKSIKLFSQNLEISRDVAIALKDKNTGLHFDWGPDSSRYLPHVETRPNSPSAEDFIQLFNNSVMKS